MTQGEINLGYGERSNSIKKATKFHIGDVLSVLTGRSLSPQGIDGIHQILNFLTQEDLININIPRALEQCKAYVASQLPHLKDIEVPGHLNEANYEIFIKEAISKYGEFHSLKPIPKINLQ